MDNDKVEFICKLSSAVLLLILICVALLMAKRRTAAPPERLSSTQADTTIAARPSAVYSNTPINGARQAKQGGTFPTTQGQQRAPQAMASSQAEPIAISETAEEHSAEQRTVRLADGRELTFGGLTFGFEHNYVHGKAPAKAHADVLPQKVDSTMRTISIKTTSPSLVVWLHCRASRGSLLEADFISIVDKSGKQGELSNPSSIFNPAEFESVGAWQVSNFPRRDPKVGIRFYSRDSSFKFHRLAEFWATNPAPQKYEVWAPEPAPIAKKIGDVEFRLVNLNGEPPPNSSQAGPAPPAEWTTSVFKVFSNGKPAPGWKIESIALSDATGNSFVPETTTFNRVGDYLMFSFNRTFWGSETAGKLRTEFLRTSGFSSNELVTFKSLRVPSAHDQLAIRAQANLNDANLHLEDIKRQMPPVRMADGSWDMELTAMLLPEVPGTHASIVALTDQTGKSFPPGISHKLGNGRQSFLFDLPAQSETVNITFAIQKSHFVEFVPSLTNENGLESHRKSVPDVNQTKQASLLGR